jgi:hypothetical protein
MTLLMVNSPLHAAAEEAAVTALPPPLLLALLLLLLLLPLLLLLLPMLRLMMALPRRRRAVAAAAAAAEAATPDRRLPPLQPLPLRLPSLLLPPLPNPKTLSRAGVASHVDRAALHAGNLVEVLPRHLTLPWPIHTLNT